MTSALAITALAFVAVALVLLIELAIRRVVLERRARRYAAAVRRVRPIAIELLEGEGRERPALPTGDQAVLAEVLGRYSRQLTGEASGRVAEYFRGSDALARSLHELGSWRTWRRAAAAYRLGDMGCEEAAPALLAALEDRRRVVRGAAARSLGRLEVVEAAKPLVEALVSERVPNGVAGEALVELGPSAVGELRVIAGHPSHRLRATAIALLGLVGDSGGSSLAVDCLGDPSAEVRATAAETLTRIGGPPAEGALRSALEDRIHFVRAGAATALGVIGSREALPRLLQMARTDAFRPARAAAQAVARISPKALAEAAEEEDAGPHLHEAADLSAL
ncbi:MAG: HEAT repeat domain-containing protein [Solirubrobacterales bacterium]|nr:HEAT repeat domain-containing protein [Solirubrobacterales bacterium]